jgi:hypothetical protein
MRNMSKAPETGSLVQVSLFCMMRFLCEIDKEVTMFNLVCDSIVTTGVVIVLFETRGYDGVQPIILISKIMIP